MSELFSRLWQTSTITGLCLLISSIAQAQPISSDGTLPNPTEVNSTAAGFEINGGTTRGGNLFHSFRDFSVPINSEAFFNNNSNIANILNRVTGGNISNIDGLIRANGNANLFLINPAGIIFGEGARLDLGGSFYGSSADSILFKDGEFSATDLDNPPLLTINAPIGLSFRDNPGDIVNITSGEGLQVLAGKILALVGGNVTFDSGNIVAPSVNVEIGGLIDTGTVTISESGSLTFPEGIARGDVSLANSSEISVMSDGGGSISVNTRNLNLTSDSSLRAGIGKDLDSVDAQAGDIVVNALESVVIDSSGIFNNIETEGIGTSGDINIFTANLTLTNKSRIDASTLGKGDSGTINIDATETVILSDLGLIFNTLGASADSLFLESENIPVNPVNKEAVGNSGDINISTTNLIMTNFLNVIATSTFGKGDSGTINIDATEAVTLNDIGIIGTATEANAVGNGGDVNISTANFTITSGSFINTSSFGTGNAGTISIKADTLSLDNVPITAEVTKDRRQQTLYVPPYETLDLATTIGGNINLEISDKLILRNDSTISSQASSNAKGGDININARFILAFPSEGDGNDILTRAENGVGGDINISTESIFNLEPGKAIPENGSNDIDSSSGLGLDGNITINTPDVNPLQVDTDIPKNLVEGEQTVAQACSSDRLAGKSGGLIVKGKGGVPPEPIEPIDSDAIVVNGQFTNPNPQVQSLNIKPIKTAQVDIYPARGVIVKEDGSFILTAYPTDLIDTRTPNIRANCN